MTVAHWMMFDSFWLVIADRVVGGGNWKGERSEGEGEWRREWRREWQAKGTKMISKASFYTLGN